MVGSVDKKLVDETWPEADGNVFNRGCNTAFVLCGQASVGAIPCISLFSGIGGLDLALRRRGLPACESIVGIVHF